MIEKIDLKNFNLLSNNLLIKPDAAYDVVVVDGAEGKKVELKIITFGEYEANHYSISGTVIKKPKETYFFNKEKANCSQLEFASSMKASLQVDCKYEFNDGDKVYYNYNVQLSCEEENRLIETEEHGICMLISLDSLFGYEKDGEITPVNGYVFFKRDTQESEVQFKHGLVGIQHVNPYGLNSATIIASSLPTGAYLDGGGDNAEEMKTGDHILVDKRFGFKMAYDLHGGDLKNVEVCYRKHVLCVTPNLN